MKDYFSRNSDDMRELVRQKTAKKRKKSANKTRRYDNQKLDKDDFVRVKLSNFQSGIRSLMKSGETKKIYMPNKLAYGDAKDSVSFDHNE